MISGSFGKTKIAEVNFYEQISKMNYRKSEILERKYNKVTTGLERVKIVYKIPEFQNIKVENDLLSISYNGQLFDSSIRIDDLIQIQKKSQAYIQEYRINEPIKEIEIQHVQDQSKKTNYFFEPEKIDIIRQADSIISTNPNNHGAQPKVEYVESQVIDDYDINEPKDFSDPNDFKEQQLDSIFKEAQKQDRNITREDVQYLMEVFKTNDPTVIVLQYQNQN